MRPIFTDKRIKVAARLALALTAWFGVLFQLWLFVRLAQANGKNLLGAIVTYFGYFTVIINIFVALISTAPVLESRVRFLRKLSNLSVAGCAVTSITVVGLGYHFLLRELWAPQGLQWLADIVLHYAVPIGAIIYWMCIGNPTHLPKW